MPSVQISESPQATARKDSSSVFVQFCCLQKQNDLHLFYSSRDTFVECAASVPEAFLSCATPGDHLHHITARHSTAQHEPLEMPKALAVLHTPAMLPAVQLPPPPCFFVTCGTRRPPAPQHSTTQRSTTQHDSLEMPHAPKSAAHPSNGATSHNRPCITCCHMQHPGISCTTAQHDTAHHNLCMEHSMTP
jgi:hypothetical protein